MAILITVINLKNQLHSREHMQYVYYPVAIVPIKYWHVAPFEENIVSLTMLKLCKLRRLSRSTLLEILNLPKQWEPIVQKELDRLVLAGQLMTEHDLYYAPPESEEGVVEKATVTTYEDGYLIFDEIQGDFFDYVHTSDFRSYPKNDLEYVLAENVQLNAHLYDEARTDVLMKTAVYSFNELEKQKIQGDQPTEETNKEPLPPHIRVDKQPFMFVQRGFIPVPLIGDIAFNDMGEVYGRVEAISPFTDEPSQKLLDIIIEQEAGKESIEWLQTLVVEDARNIDFDPDDIVEEISRQLQGVRVHRTVFEHLQAGELWWRDYQRNDERVPANRASAINAYSLAIEALLKERVTALDSWETPEPLATAYKHKKLMNYLKQKFYLLEIPQTILSNCKTIAEKFVRYGHLEKVPERSIRDYIAKLLLFSAYHDQQLLKKFAQHKSIFHMIERIVLLRNKAGGHFNEEILTMDLDIYNSKLTQLRQDVYECIQFWEAI